MNGVNKKAEDCSETGRDFDCAARVLNALESVDTHYRVTVFACRQFPSTVGYNL